jgi:hypothetical protein
MVQKNNNNSVACNCGQLISKRGWASHKRACRLAADVAPQDLPRDFEVAEAG